VDHEDRAGVGGDGELFIGEDEFTDDGVLESFCSGAVGADVVGTSQGAECGAAGGELSDEILQIPVVGVASCFCSHDREAHLSEQVPVGVEVAGCGVEELEKHHRPK
jgi:hypothetical protein